MTASTERRRLRPDAARAVALDTVLAVSNRDAYANLILPRMLRDRGVTGRDAAFATELAYGTLRGTGTYDAVLSHCVDRPLERLDPVVRAVLRMGTHQALGMRTAAHAAVSESVGLARARIGDGPGRLVNAVMRRVVGHSLPDWIGILAPQGTDQVRVLALRHAHPDWIVRAFGDALGPARAELPALLAADNTPAKVTLVARPGRSRVETLLEAGAEPGRWSPYAAVLPAGDPADIPAVASGAAGVQDEGSQLVVQALAEAPLTGPDAQWLDMCAGPGGKAALLAGLATKRDARLLALELQEHRARLVTDALGDAVGGHEVRVVDATDPAAVPEAQTDRVLVDAPCTGLGALRRRPEPRWRRQPGDVPELRRLQAGLLRAALRAVRPGGVVAYATCSPHLAETRTVVGDVMRGRDDVEHIDARSLLPALPHLGDGPDVQMWPHRHGTDAMYLALLRRTS